MDAVNVDKLSAGLEKEKLSFSDASFFSQDMEKVFSAVRFLKTFPVTAKEDAHSLVEYAGSGKDGLRYYLNYQDRDLKFHKGVLVEVSGFPYPEDAGNVLSRLSVLSERDSFAVSDSVRDYVYSCYRGASKEESDSFAYSFARPVYGVCTGYSVEQDKRHAFDVLREEASSLVSVDFDSDSSFLLVSLNYKDIDGKIFKGVSFPVKPPSEFDSYDAVNLFADGLKKVYSNPGICRLQGIVRSWHDGSDRIEAGKVIGTDGSGLDLFSNDMAERRKAMLSACQKLVDHTMEDTLNRLDDVRMQQAYGTRPDIVELVSSDENEAVLRLNYMHGDSESGFCSCGVEYKMSWAGTGVASLRTKSQYLTLFMDRYINNPALQERIWYYKLDRFRGGDNGNDQKVQLLSDDRSSDLALALAEFDRDLRDNLPKYRKEWADKREEKLRELNLTYRDFSTRLDEKRQEISKMGFWGRLKMRILNYRKWKEKKDAELQLVEKVESIGSAIRHFVEPEVNGDNFLKPLRELEPNVAKEEDKAFAASRSAVDTLTVEGHSVDKTKDKTLGVASGKDGSPEVLSPDISPRQDKSQAR